MSKTAKKGFEGLIELAGKFVETQKGVWDVFSWLSFLSEVNEKGYNITNEIQSGMESTVDSMRKFYLFAKDTKGMGNIMIDISKHVNMFLRENRGVWGHSEFMEFLEGFKKRGIKLDEETSNYLGGILEASKEIYFYPLQTSKRKKKKNK